VVKRTAACVKAAGAAQAAAGAPPGANMPELAAYSFPAIVPVVQSLMISITDVQLPQICVASSAAAAAAAVAGQASHPSSSSSSAEELQQVRASLMLLAVLVARSVVVLVDAMEAAAAAAGMTAAQLYARWVALACHDWCHTALKTTPEATFRRRRRGVTWCVQAATPQRTPEISVSCKQLKQHATVVDAMALMLWLDWVT
jgi:hypothetical protein